MSVKTRPAPETSSRQEASHSRSEILGAYAWICLGALLSALLEVVYLGTWVQLPGGHAIPLPYTILVALFFNAVLTRTAMLWTRRAMLSLVPLAVWLLAVVLLAMSGVLHDSILLPVDIRGMLLLVNGGLGGMWPLLMRFFVPQSSRSQ